MRVVLLLMLAFIAAPAFAQSPLAELARDEAVRRQATGGRAVKVYTNTDLPPVLTPVFQPPAARPSAIYEHFLEHRAALERTINWNALATAPVPHDPLWPFTSPATPIQPLAPPWSVTTYYGRHNVVTFFNGQPFPGQEPVFPYGARSGLHTVRRPH